MKTLSLAMITLLLPAAAAATPWYQLPDCKAALKTVNQAELAPARAAIAKLRASRDPARIACGVWLETPLSEVEFAREGKSAALTARRMGRLGLMMKFARRFGPRDPAFADLELEARLRRIRILAQKKERMAMVKEARRVRDMLQARAHGPRSATVEYAEGVLNLALADTSWAVRQALSLAGLSGEKAVGVKKLKAVAAGGSVYEMDARYLLRHFQKGDAAQTLAQSAALYKRFPGSPQFAYDYALDLYGQQRCPEALPVIAPLRAALQQQPSKWTPFIRGRLYWLNARCAADTHDLKTARADVALAEAQNYGRLAGRIQSLKQQLSAR